MLLAWPSWLRVRRRGAGGVGQVAPRCSAASQAEAMRILMRRTLKRTSAPILRSLRDGAAVARHRRLSRTARVRPQHDAHERPAAADPPSIIPLGLRHGPALAAISEGRSLATNNVGSRTRTAVDSSSSRSGRGRSAPPDARAADRQWR